MPPETGEPRYDSCPHLGLLGCDHESGDILRDELDSQSRPEIVEPEVPEVFVEVAECRREHNRLDPGRSCPLGQGCRHGIAGGIAILSDIETPERCREQESGEVICRERRDQGHRWQGAAKREHGFDGPRP